MHHILYDSSTGALVHTALGPQVNPLALASGADAYIDVTDLPDGIAEAGRYKVVNGGLVDQSEDVDYEAAQLAQAITSAEDEVDARHEVLVGAVASRRPTVLTVYPFKESQARVYLADPPTSPVAADWPWLAAEVGASVPDSGDPAVDLAAAAKLIVQKANAWAAAVARAERVRLAAKAAVRAAMTRAEVQAVLDDLTWPDLTGSSAEGADDGSGAIRTGGRRSGSVWRRIFGSQG